MLLLLSQRLRPILRKLAADESRVTAKFASSPLPKFSAPHIIRETNDLVEATLMKIMEEIEKGPGSLLG